MPAPDHRDAGPIVRRLGYHLPVTDEEGNRTGETDANLSALLQSFDLQIAFTDWLALRGSATGAAVMGTSQESLLINGAVLNYTFGGGASARLFRSERFQLSASLDMPRGRYVGANVLDFAQRTIETGELSLANLYTETRSLDVGGGLQAAWSPDPVIGFWMASDLYWLQNEQGGETGSSLALSAGLGMSLDLLAVGVPVGLMANYKYERGLSESATPSPWYGGGLFYTGRQDLGLGVEVALNELPTRGQTATVVYGLLRLQSYW